MLNNMANYSSTGVNFKEFAKSFVEPYLLPTPHPLNSSLDLDKERELALVFMIGPWIAKANGVTQANFDIADYTLDNWSTQWDNCDSDDLQKYAPLEDEREFVNVSAFLTGRTYDGTTYDDDRDESDDNDLDDTYETEDVSLQLFYVNDPANSKNTPANNFFENNTLQHGFNDLERRKMFMCRYLSTKCDRVTVPWPSDRDQDLFTFIFNATNQPMTE
jgi:hypothetical protein